MSLLLDARKKIELALEQSGIHKAIEPQLAETLRLEDSPAFATPPDARPSGGIGAGSDPVAAPARGAPVGAPLLRNDTVAAGKNLFAAKTVPASPGGRLGIIPIAIISGLVLAAGGGYYVWREISPPPMAQRQHLAPPPVASATNTVAPNPSSTIAPAPAAPLPKDSPVTTGNQHVAEKTPAISKHASLPELVRDTPQISPSPPLQNEGAAGGEILSAQPAQPISIKHSKESDAVDPTLLVGYQAYRNGDLRTAWQHYSDVLHKDAKNRDAILGLAAIAQQQSQDTIAARYYDQVLALDPRDPIAHAGMSALFGAANAASTESRLKLLLSQQPQSAALHFALGNLYAEQSRWSDAQQAYFNAYNLEPDNAQLAFNLAVSLDHLGKGKLAVQHYQHALQLDGAGFDRAQTQQRLNELTAP